MNRDIDEDREIASKMTRIICDNEGVSKEDRQAALVTLIELIDPDIIADANRWAFVRNNLIRVHSLKMNGNHSYSFRSISSTGESIDEAIDKLLW